MGTNLDNHLKDQSQKLWVHPVNKLTSGSISYTVRVSTRMLKHPLICEYFQ